MSSPMTVLNLFRSTVGDYALTDSIFRNIEDNHFSGVIPEHFQAIPNLRYAVMSSICLLHYLINLNMHILISAIV